MGIVKAGISWLEAGISTPRGAFVGRAILLAVALLLVVCGVSLLAGASLVAKETASALTPTRDCRNVYSDSGRLVAEGEDFIISFPLQGWLAPPGDAWRIQFFGSVEHCSIAGGLLCRRSELSLFVELDMGVAFLGLDSVERPQWMFHRVEEEPLGPDLYSSGVRRTRHRRPAPYQASAGRFGPLVGRSKPDSFRSHRSGSAIFAARFEPHTSGEGRTDSGSSQLKRHEGKHRLRGNLGVAAMWVMETAVLGVAPRGPC